MSSKYILNHVYKFECGIGTFEVVFFMEAKKIPACELKVARHEMLDCFYYATGNTHTMAFHRALLQFIERYLRDENVTEENTIDEIIFELSKNLRLRLEEMLEDEHKNIKVYQITYGG